MDLPLEVASWIKTFDAEPLQIPIMQDCLLVHQAQAHLVLIPKMDHLNVWSRVTPVPVIEDARGSAQLISHLRIDAGDDGAGSGEVDRFRSDGNLNGTNLLVQERRQNNRARRGINISV